MTAPPRSRDRPPEARNFRSRTRVSGEARERPPRQSPFAQFPKPGLGARLEQTKLRLRQVHSIANLFLRLFQQIKPRENLAVALRNAVQHSFGDLFVLL